MPCLYPRAGYRSFSKNQNGKHPVIFAKRGGINAPPGSGGEKLTIPCGYCIGCRLERSRQWAMRCVHEASLHDKNCWITLTYDEDHLPLTASGKPTLVKRDFQLFMKKFRKKFGKGIRYYYAGEYGDNFGRPHYHACVFNFDFGDKELGEQTELGHDTYTSQALEELWGKGRTQVAALTFETAAYTARYITKKLFGKRKEEYGDRCPEFTDMSRRPGIGRGWFDLWKDDTYPSDSVVLNGRALQPPKAYDRWLEKYFPAEFMKIKFQRFQKTIDENYRDMKRFNSTGDWAFRRCDERIQKRIVSRINLKKQLTRRYENGS